MSEARHFLHTLRSAPAGDVTVLLVCFGLTILFDMVLAVAVGIGLGAALFIRRMASLTKTDLVDTSAHPTVNGLPHEVAVYDINGPMFFGAAEKALTSLRLVDPKIRIIILDMQDVPTMDGTAIVALQVLIEDLLQDDVSLILTGLPTRIIIKLRRARVRKVMGKLTYAGSLIQARAIALRWLAS